MTDKIIKQASFLEGMITEESEIKEGVEVKGASKLINVLIGQDGSIRRRPGTSKTSCKLELNSYIFSTYHNKDYFIVVINEKFLELYNENGDVLIHQTFAIWKSPKLCKVIFWGDEILILNPWVKPKLLYISKLMDKIEIKDFKFSKDEDGITKQPFARIKHIVPAVHLNIIPSRDYSKKREYLLTCEEPIFAELEVAMLIKVRGYVYTIISITNDRSIKLLGHLIKNPVSRLITKDWLIQAFNNKFGHPTMGCLFQGRFVLSGSTRFPNYLWLSDIGDHGAFTENPGNDAAALSIQLIITAKHIIIKHLIVQKSLLIMSSDGIYIVEGFPITALKYKLYKINSQAAGDISPLLVNSTVIFTAKGNNSLLGLQYDEAILNYRIFELSKKILTNLYTITSMAYVHNLSTLFLSDNKYNIWALKLNPNNIFAWSKIIIPKKSVTTILSIKDNLYFVSKEYNSFDSFLYYFDKSSYLDDTIRVSSATSLRHKVRLHHYDKKLKYYITGQKAVNYALTDIVLGQFTIDEILTKISKFQARRIINLKIGNAFNIECESFPISITSSKNYLQPNRVKLNKITFNAKNSGSFSLINTDGTLQNLNSFNWKHEDNSIVFLASTKEETLRLLTSTHLINKSIPWRIKQTLPIPFHMHGLICGLS